MAVIIKETGLERHLGEPVHIEDFYGIISSDTRGFYLLGDKYEYRIKNRDIIYFSGHGARHHEVESGVPNRKIRLVK